MDCYFPGVGSLSPLGGLELSKSYALAHRIRLGSQERSTTERGLKSERLGQTCLSWPSSGGGAFRRPEQRGQRKGMLQGCSVKHLASAVASTPTRTQHSRLFALLQRNEGCGVVTPNLGGRQKAGQKKEKTIKLVRKFFGYLVSISMETGTMEKKQLTLSFDVPFECS